MNHFIELCKDKNNNYWLTVHSGSRSFGKDIAVYHEKIAVRYQKTKGRHKLTEKLKAQHREREIETQLKLYDQRQNITIPNIPYLEGNLLDNYLSDIKLADIFAFQSRKIMLDTIMKNMNWTSNFSFDSVHNNIDQKNNIIRKGATSASKGELLLIPLNMRDGSLICEGLGNNDWNYSAPHGAGRVLSRSQAKEFIDLNEYKKQMKDIYTSSVTMSTLDEAPDVYKPIDDIIDNIENKTVKIVHRLKPVYNFKAH